MVFRKGWPNMKRIQSNFKRKQEIVFDFIISVKGRWICITWHHYHSKWNSENSCSFINDWPIPIRPPPVCHNFQSKCCCSFWNNCSICMDVKVQASILNPMHILSLALPFPSFPLPLALSLHFLSIFSLPHSLSFSLFSLWDSHIQQDVPSSPLSPSLSPLLPSLRPLALHIKQIF